MIRTLVIILFTIQLLVALYADARSTKTPRPTLDTRGPIWSPNPRAEHIPWRKCRTEACGRTTHASPRYPEVHGRIRMKRTPDDVLKRMERSSQLIPERIERSLERITRNLNRFQVEREAWNDRSPEGLEEWSDRSQEYNLKPKNRWWPYYSSKNEDTDDSFPGDQTLKRLSAALESTDPGEQINEHGPSAAKVLTQCLEYCRDSPSHDCARACVLSFYSQPLQDMSIRNSCKTRACLQRAHLSSVPCMGTSCSRSVNKRVISFDHGYLKCADRCKRMPDISALACVAECG